MNETSSSPVISNPELYNSSTKRICIDTEEYQPTTIITTQLVNTALNIAEIDPSQRRELFNKTMCYLLYESKHTSFYIAECVKDDFMKFETLIPFIEHFIKCCTKDVLAEVKKRFAHIKYKKEIDPNFSLENQRKKMVTYHNSLLIMKHFNGLP